MASSDDYLNGKCQGCSAKIQPLGPSSRCEECDAKMIAYRESNWGLDEIIASRNMNEALGLCFHCGTGLEDGHKVSATGGGYNRLCSTCAVRSEQGRWCKEMVRKGGKPIEEANPYNSVFDTVLDNAVNLTPTFGTMADRMRGKARYYEQKAKRGGPRGREDAADAKIYRGIAERMQAKFDDVSRYK